MSSFLRGVMFEWTDDDVFRPLPHFKKRCSERLVVHQQYRLNAEELRSVASENHYYAALDEIFANLPDDLKERIPSREHLRKLALVRTGFRTERVYSFADEETASRFAKDYRDDEPYAVIVPDGAVVTIYQAESQSRAKQGAKRFAESKDAVLGYCSSLIGVEVDTLRRNAGMAA